MCVNHYSFQTPKKNKTLSVPIASQALFALHAAGPCTGAGRVLVALNPGSEAARVAVQ
jgi:hypothetical protein